MNDMADLMSFLSRNAPNSSRQIYDPRIKLVQAAGPNYIFAIENTAAMNLQVGDDWCVLK